MASPDGATRPSFNADQPDSQSQLLQPDSTLTVGQSITLTLGSDALVITGEHCLTIHACRSWLHMRILTSFSYFYRRSLHAKTGPRLLRITVKVE
jgi:hypothetical protein